MSNKLKNFVDISMSFGRIVIEKIKTGKWNFIAAGLAGLTAFSLLYWGDNKVSELLGNLGEIIPPLTPKLVAISASLIVATVAARALPAWYRHAKTWIQTKTEQHRQRVQEKQRAKELAEKGNNYEVKKVHPGMQEDLFKGSMQGLSYRERVAARLRRLVRRRSFMKWKGNSQHSDNDVGRAA